MPLNLAQAKAQDFHEASWKAITPVRTYKSNHLSLLKDPIEPTNRPESLQSFVFEWLESVGSDRQKRRRLSASHIHRPNDDPVVRNPKSDPGMAYRLTSGTEYRRDADGIPVPLAPSSVTSRSYQYQNRTSATSSTVRRPVYRQHNLQLNNVSFNVPSAPLRNHVSSHVGSLLASRNSVPLSTTELNDTMRHLQNLTEGCDEQEVSKFLDYSVFAYSKTHRTQETSPGLERAVDAPISRHLVPANRESPYRISQPKPDMLYGYSGNAGQAFTQPQLLAQTKIHDNPDYAVATSRGLRFPFLAIEIKSSCSGGSLWVAANQCAGASAACLNAVNQLNIALEACQSAHRVDDVSYAIAVDEKMAEIYISWIEDGAQYRLQEVDSFLLSRPREFQDFRCRVRYILDWGRDTRLRQIRDALDIILEENRKAASAAAKNRRRSGSPEVSGKRRKSSSSLHGENSRSGRSRA
ncbi:hypothetical protein GQ602_001055 [Ophiocordyceps camponoti-floridani]|uniref:DUF7924 domain-containing protein n=1 Tax=Ophiocordyceps camponoti-floridani TaxID=2030778 RepID=A0A8H4QDF1_9HYPO|nr:hypothetical protein GQ602_001055 [Ophiocordyceps camponoti-floridani]